MDEEADAGDDQDHHRRQRVEPERRLDLERSDPDPGVERVAQHGSLAETVELEAPPRRRRRTPRGPRRGRRGWPPRASDGRPSDGSRPPARAGGSIHRSSVVVGHHRSSATSSALIVSRWRKSGEDDRQPDRGLGGGDGHDEEDDHLAVHRPQAAGEGDEGQVDGVQHQLDRHEDDDQRCDASARRPCRSRTARRRARGTRTRRRLHVRLSASRQHDRADHRDQEQQRGDLERQEVRR